MWNHARRAATGALLSLALVAAASCKQGPTPETQAKLDQLEKAAADRDKVLQELAENTRFVSEISTELAKVRVPQKSLKVSSESPLRASRDSVVQKIRYITRRVGEMDARLKESEGRIHDLSTLSDSLRNMLEATVQNLQGVIDTQKETIAALTEQVDKLTAENVALQDTLGSMAREQNTVYYVIGTKDELEKKGLIQATGGARFLFVLWKQGETLVPARHLDPSEFTPVDRRNLPEIPVERDQEYRIVSRQDVTALETPPDGDGKIVGPAKIADSARFWRPSKFLIIVQG